MKLSKIQLHKIVQSQGLLPLPGTSLFLAPNKKIKIVEKQILKNEGVLISLLNEE